MKIVFLLLSCLVCAHALPVDDSDAVAELPSDDAVKEHPSDDAVKENPSDDAVKEHPSDDAVEELPSEDVADFPHYDEISSDISIEVDRPIEEEADEMYADPGGANVDIVKIDERANTDEIARKMGDKARGDEILTPNQVAIENENDKIFNGRKRGAVRPASNLWRKGSNGRVRIPYTRDIGSWYSWRWETKNNLEDTMQHLSKNTCIDWVKKKSSDRNWVAISDDEAGCWAHVGFVGGKQKVNLGKGCTSQAVTDHELMHTMGFWHEQSRPDRDRSLKIHWKNIQKDVKDQFEKHGHTMAITHGFPFDFGSVMLYGDTAGAIIPGAITMSRINGRTRWRTASEFDEQDYASIRKAYGC